jgi:hypothetical protein
MCEGRYELSAPHMEYSLTRLLNQVSGDMCSVKKPRTMPGLEFAGDDKISNAPRPGRRSRRSGSSPVR